MNEYGLPWLDEDPFILGLWRLIDLGHVRYQGEQCQINRGSKNCPECSLISEHIG
jgi:hypothetical protein